MTNYRLVPVEPTEEMLAAGHYAMVDGCHPGGVYASMLAAAPDVQGMPVAWSGWGCQYPGKMPRLYGDRHIAELNCDTENGDQVLYFTTAPQPAEQQPEPISRNLRAAHAMILNVLDRDAADGRVVRGEMAAELRSAISEQSVIRHDWDDQDKCRRCGDRDWYASPTCTPKQQEKSHDN